MRVRGLNRPQSNCLTYGRYGSVLQIPEVISIAASHNVAPAQVGLKWVAQQGLPMTTAVWRQDYMVEDMDLWSWGNLTDAEMKTLSNLQAPNATLAAFVN